MSDPNVDLLMLTALTEEQQVVHSVLKRNASVVGQAGQQQTRVSLYEYATGGRRYLIATACAHEMGAVHMGTFASALLASGIRPASAVLVGIAATINRREVALGDVPVASEIYSADDIKMSKGRGTFRTHGFQVDGSMKLAAGRLREDDDRHTSWKSHCAREIRAVVEALNAADFRPTRITFPDEFEPPRLHLEIGAGGPFLVADTKFRNALRKSNDRWSAVHAKLAWVEMEAHGLMRAAQTFSVPAIVMKGISDAGDPAKARIEKKTGGFFRAYACSNSVIAVLHVLQQDPRAPIPAGSRLAPHGKERAKAARATPSSKTTTRSTATRGQRRARPTADDATAALPPATNRDDPNRGRFGGSAVDVDEGLKLEIIFHADHTEQDTFWFDVVIHVGPGRDAGPFRVHLFEDYAKPIIDLKKLGRDGTARLKDVSADEAFTIGVQVFRRGRWIPLEYDLATLDGLPRRFLPRRKKTAATRPFPSFIDAIAGAIDDAPAGSEILVATDYAGYGAFSAPAHYARYVQALARAHERGCRIRILVTGRKALASHRDPASRTRAEASYLENRTAPPFRELLDRLADNLHGAKLHRPPGAPRAWSYDAFLEALDSLELHCETVLGRLGDLRQCSTWLPQYLWITDAVAVAAAPRFDVSERMNAQATLRRVNPHEPKDRVEVAEEASVIRARDGIVEQLRRVFEHYWTSAR